MGDYSASRLPALVDSNFSRFILDARNYTVVTLYTVRAAKYQVGVVRTRLRCPPAPTLP